MQIATAMAAMVRRLPVDLDSRAMGRVDASMVTGRVRRSVAFDADLASIDLPRMTVRLAMGCVLAWARFEIALTSRAIGWVVARIGRPIWRARRASANVEARMVLAVLELRLATA